MELDNNHCSACARASDEIINMKALGFSEELVFL